MSKIIFSLKKLWRNWLRSESPRRAVLKWSGPEKAGLTILCFVVAIISSLHLLQVPDFEPGMPALKDEIAPRDALVKYRNAQQNKGSEISQNRFFVQVL